MIKKSIICFFILMIIVFIYKSLLLPLYIQLYPPSLHLQLYFSVEKECKNKSNCMVHLHKMTPFKWDKAYFFAYNSGYGYQPIQNINRVTGITDDLKVTAKKNLVLFTFKGKIIKYSFFETMDYYSIFEHSSIVIIVIPIPKFYINFETNRKELRQFHYSGSTDVFEEVSDLVGIKYYELTPDNDWLHAMCFFEDSKDDVSNAVKQCGFSFTNLDQVHLFNPKIDKK